MSLIKIFEENDNTNHKNRDKTKQTNNSGHVKIVRLSLKNIEYAVLADFVLL